ncbi:hypothetical protein ASPZODRAFT_130860 [Penicilliopsis zonata CBS 506.65]|uniref:Uncharacterized protein n=1 Tax=Penicilliopsis zonata CBS 506.65 TaxID=1073090 RepID=A0A1L9SNW0_9EURO|nr:hypothetical protein ASPZODRAFT_130860 [Penicilliopsis zonata CBS 506.65]OJJ48744.1 hypothetical protein ASPZODRAFT_130860 [Penicilliopsis zonata CBS 506.65]
MSVSSDQMLFQMNEQEFYNEWLEFGNSFDLTTGLLVEDVTAVGSISPTEYSLETIDGSPSFSSQTIDYSPHSSGMETPADLATPGHDFAYALDCPSFLPKESLPEFAIQETFLDLPQNHEPAYFPGSTVRELVEARAAADHRCISRKEKLREASIAVHLQRLMDATAAEIDMQPNDSSPCWADYVDYTLYTPSATTASTTAPSLSSTSPPQHSSSSPPSGPEGGVEMVLDLNMNTTTNVPRKQKPRSLAQKESYIKARKHGACEKHRKQHKRCKCFEKATTQVSQSLAIINPLMDSKMRTRKLPVDNPSFIKSRDPYGTSVRMKLPDTLMNPADQLAAPLRRPLCSSPLSPNGAQQSLQTSAPKSFHSSAHAHRWITERPQLQTRQSVLGEHVQLTTSSNRILAAKPLDRSSASSILGGRHSSTIRTNANSTVILQKGVGSEVQSSTGLSYTATHSTIATLSSASRFAGLLPFNLRAGIAAKRSVHAFASFWDTCTFASSWVSGFCARLARSSCRQILCARKGLGLFQT